MKAEISIDQFCKKARRRGALIKHGMIKTPLYRRWKAMNWRCSSRTGDRRFYMDRGVFVCEEWKDFVQFKDDMGDSFHPSLTLDRIDTLKPYCKENCRWITIHDQQNNRRNNRKVFDGTTMMNVSEFARLYGIPYNTVYKRWKIGHGVEDLITRHKRPK